MDYLVLLIKSHMTSRLRPNLVSLFFLCQVIAAAASIEDKPTFDYISQVVRDTCWEKFSELESVSCISDRNPNCDRPIIELDDLGCKCDSICIEYGDCCFDFAHWCPKDNTTTASQPAEVPLGGPNKSHACFIATLGFNTLTSTPFRGVWLISRCATDWPDHHEKVKYSCETGSGSRDGHTYNYPYELPAGTTFRHSLLDRLPVYDIVTGRHYRNEACAKCNRVPRSHQRRWGVHVTCDYDKGLHDVLSGPETLMSSLEIAVTAGCRLEIRAVGDYEKPRQCFREPVISNCSTDWTGDRKVEAACHSYTGYVIQTSTINFQDRPTLYRNPHCMMCNSLEGTAHERDNLVQCYIIEHAAGRRIPPVPQISFFLLFDTPDDSTLVDPYLSSGTTHCPPGTTLNQELNVCTLSTTSNSITSELFISYSPPRDGDMCSNQSRDDATDCSHHSEPPQSILSTIETWIRLKLEGTHEDVDISVSISTNISNSTHHILTPHELGNSSSPLYTLQSTPLYKLHAIIKYDITELSDSSNISKSINHTLSEIISDPMNKEKEFKSDGDTADSGVVRLVGVGQVGELFQPACHGDFLVLLSKNEVEYEIVTDNSEEEGDNNLEMLIAHHLPTNRNLTLNSSQFMLKDSQLFVCEEVYSEFLSFTSSPPPPTSLPWLGTLTFALTIISIFCLLLGILLHLSIKTLRTLAGYNLSSLMLTLLFSHVFLLLQPSLSSLLPHSSCTPLAATLHFLFLWAFTWMNICSFSIYRTFTNLFSSRSSSTSPFSTYLRYLLYSLLYPSLPVIITLCLHYSNKISPPPYSTSHLSLCWFGNTLVFVLLFGLPLLIIILSNIFFFLSTLRVIYNRPTLPSSLPSSTTHNVMISFRITVLVGITWLLPFLALLLPSSSTSYLVARVLADITNALQGTFIFLAYVLRRQVWEDSRKKWRKIGAKKRKISSSTSTTPTESIPISTTTMTTLTSIST